MKRADGMRGQTGRPSGRILILSLLLALTIGGCGYKTLPVPPEEVVPKPVTDLEYELDEKGVALSWTYPSETVHGEPLSEVTSFQLYRAVVPAEEYCDTCPVPFGEPIQVPGGVVPAEKPKTATYETTLLRPGHLYFFKVRARTGWWAESAGSNIVSFMWDIPPSAPENLAARPGDSRIFLNWQPVTAHMDGTPISDPVRYRVFRNMGGGPFKPLGGLLEESEFVDTAVVNGRRYAYKVQAVTMYEKGRVGGGIAGPVETSPVDMTPPPVPAGVQAIRTAAGVKVVWNPVRADDVAGYQVYRRLPDQKSAEMIGEVRVPATIFDDRNPPDTGQWFYSVSSIDDGTPANESETSPEVRVLR